MDNPDLAKKTIKESEEKKPVKLGREPVEVECPHCHAKGMTKTEKEGSKAHRIATSTASILTSVITQLPLAHGRRNVIHYCSSCGEEVGKQSGLVSAGVDGGAAPVLAA